MASFVGVPLMMDKHTATRSRMFYDRVCMEMAVDSYFPSQIDALVGKVRIKMHVEYSWKPPKCLHCGVFGHTQDKCVDVAAAAAEEVIVETSLVPGKKAFETDGWVIKSLKRGRGNNSSKNEGICVGNGDGASSIGTGSVREIPVSVKNKFQQLIVGEGGERMEVEPV